MMGTTFAILTASLRCGFPQPALLPLPVPPQPQVPQAGRFCADGGGAGCATGCGALRRRCRLLLRRLYRRRRWLNLLAAARLDRLNRLLHRRLRLRRRRWTRLRRRIRRLVLVLRRLTRASCSCDWPGHDLRAVRTRTSPAFVFFDIVVIRVVVTFRFHAF